MKRSKQYEQSKAIYLPHILAHFLMKYKDVYAIKNSFIV